MQKAQATPSYFTTLDLARRWNRSPERVRQWARAGLLKPSIVTDRGTRLYTDDDILRFEAERPAIAPKV